jgi:outer membrane lipoprotein-sorting protein
VTARLIALIALLAPAIAHAQPAKPAPTAAQVLANVEATYKQATQLTATFAQSVTNPVYGTTSKSAGSISAARPDKMRWDYLKAGGKPGKFIVFDGKTLWIVEPSKTEITKIPAQATNTPASLAFFIGAGTLAKTFNVAFAKGSTTTLTLTPKQPSAQYAQLELVIDPATWQVTKTTVTDSSGGTNAIELSKVDLKASIAPSQFTFNPASYPLYKVTVIAPPPPQPLKPAPKP